MTRNDAINQLLEVRERQFWALAENTLGRTALNEAIAAVQQGTPSAEVAELTREALLP